MKKLPLFKVLFTLLFSTASLSVNATVGEAFGYNGLAFRITSEEAKTVSLFPLYTGNSYPVYITYGTSVVIPSTVVFRGQTYTVTEISENAFASNSSAVENVTIPGTIVEIVKNRFSPLVNLKTITILSSDTSLSITGSGEVYADSVYFDRELVGLSFSDWFNHATKVEFGPTVTAIKDRQFLDSKLTHLSIPSTIKSIGNYAFYRSGSLTKVELPTELNSIGESAFQYCGALTDVNIPGGIETIPDFCFTGCALDVLTIPENISSIGRGAFERCPLSKLIIADSDSLLSIPGESSNSPSFAGAQVEYLYIGRSVAYNVTSPFAGNTLKEVVIGDKVKSLNFAFRDCTQLESVCLGANLNVQLNGYAFANCTSLVNVDLTSKMENIPYRMFQNCTSLKSVTLPDSITYISGKSFEGCSSLERITIPSNVTEIGYYCFTGCTNLHEIVFEDGAKNLVIEHPASILPDCPVDSAYLGRNLLYKHWPYGIIYSDWVVELFPQSLTKLHLGTTYAGGNTRFGGNKNLTSIYVPWEQPVPIAGETFHSDVYQNAALLVPGGTVKNYQATSAWNQFANIVPTNIGVRMTATAGGSVRLGDEVVTDGTTLLQVKPNSVLTFEITPEEEYYIESVVLNGEDVTAQVADGRLTPTDLSEDLELTVTFAAKPYYTVTATATAGGTATVAAESVMMGRGTTVTLTANEGHELVSVTVNGTDRTSEVTDGVLTLSNIRENQTVAATFQKLRYAITAMECENGSIHLSATEVEWGGEVVATLGGAAHYEVATVSVNGEDRTAQLDGNHLTITDVRQNITIGATFRLERFAVTATSNEGGTVLLSTDVAEWGSSVTVTVSPLSGYELVSISVDDEDVTERLTGSTYTIASVEHDTEVAAEFHLITEATIKLSAYGESTYCSDHDLDFSGVEGLKAYIASGYYPATGSVLLTRITEVPAGTGIMVKGEQGTYKVPYTETSAYFVNMFVGNVEAISINPTEGEMTNLYLTTGAGGFGFYRVTKTRTMSANRARLQLPTSLLPAEGRVGLLFEDETQGIDDLRIDDLRLDSSATYDLQGRRVDSSISKKGLYIRNGKKVVINR